MGKNVESYRPTLAFSPFTEPKRSNKKKSRAFYWCGRFVGFSIECAVNDYEY